MPCRGGSTCTGVIPGASSSVCVRAVGRELVLDGERDDDVVDPYVALPVPGECSHDESSCLRGRDETRFQIMSPPLARLLFSRRGRCDSRPIKRGLAFIAILSLFAATAARVDASTKKDAPTLSIAAVFDEGAKATYYTANLKAPGSAGMVSTPTYTWHLQPPPDDPGCRQFAPMPGKSVESVWYHDKSDGCTHLSPAHNGTVSVQATVVLANDKRPWVCNAAYVGTLTGPGEEGLCTIEAPATHAVARPPISEKDKAKILADLFDECAETETAIAAVAGAAALPTGGISAAPGILAGGAAAGCTILARIAKRKAEDPPDRNFLVIPVARAAGVPQFQPSATVPYLVSYAFDALSDNITATEGYTNAFTTAINRASGAHAAGDPKAQTAQEIAAMFDAGAIAVLDDERPTLRANLKTSLLQSGVQSRSFSAAQIRAVRGKGLPASVRAALRRAGFPGSALGAVGRAAPAAGSFPAALTAPSTADRQDAALMRAYVAFVRKALGG